MPDLNWMISGATGYTGRLVAKQARQRGMTPVLAGRDPERVEHCAGPFVRTSAPGFVTEIEGVTAGGLESTRD